MWGRVSAAARRSSWLARRQFRRDFVAPGPPTGVRLRDYWSTPITSPSFTRSFGATPPTRRRLHDGATISRSRMCRDSQRTSVLIATHRARRRLGKGSTTRQPRFHSAACEGSHSVDLVRPKRFAIASRPYSRLARWHVCPLHSRRCRRGISKMTSAKNRAPEV